MRSVQLSEAEAVGRKAGMMLLEWLQGEDLDAVVRVGEQVIEDVKRGIKGGATAEELRSSFAEQQTVGGMVTREEVAAWHRTSLRQVSRWQRKGLLTKLPGYGRKAMFDSRVACRLRPKRKEG